MLALMTDAFGGYGGIAQYNRDFLSAAADACRPGPIMVLARMANDELGPLPPRVEQKSPTMNKFGYAARALALALRQRPKVIYNAHLYHGPLSMRLARLTGAKLVSQLHGTEIWDDVPRGCMAALEASDLVLTVSRDTCARTLAKARIAPEKVVVINNTVGAQFTPGDRPGDRDAARRRFGLDREIVLLTVARLDGRDGYKGHDRVIPLLPRLLAIGVDTVYLIAGEGPDQARLLALAQRHGVADRVRFLGKIPVEALPDLYRAADVFALPSTGEGFGISFVEAMACGTPAIGLAIGGAPDALVDGTLGTCVAPEHFAEALIDLLVQHSDRLADRPADLAARTRHHFDYPIFANQIRTQLQKVW